MSQANLKTVKQKLKIPNRFDVILLNDDTLQWSCSGCVEAILSKEF